MAQDGLPNMYSHPPTESSKITSETTIFFEGDNNIPRPEATITSEGDHATSANDCMLENDFSTTIGSKISSTKERRKSEDEVETHIKSTAPLEREKTTPTGATSSIKEYNAESFIPVNIGKVSSPVATVSLIDFSSITKEDVFLATADIGDKDPAEPAEGSGRLAESTSSPASAAEKGKTDANSCSASLQPTDSFIPEAENSPSTDNDYITIPDITALEEENITEIDLVVSQDDSKAVDTLRDTDEKYVTVFELTTSAEKDKGDLEETLNDEEATIKAGVWMQKNTIKEAETESILLTAAESRYDFSVPVSAAEKITEEREDDTTEDAPENNTTESTPEDTEQLSDSPNHEEDTSPAETGIFKLLKEDPDELMM
ncbi:calcium-binding and spermatid-specific protein 1 [Octodon degus]|uniref:Calcium-binding and spermatid-specific protein 1 n=1 Tax=Octodon degus TaxID=10160 RepID=A0A6P3FL82_OCTDE|nr:calcium-binding and spermatid-specific protein 1 [Octodon degus]